MNVSEIVSKYENQSDAELTQTVVVNYDLTQAILASHPQMAQDAGFELFDPNWAKRYWRNIAGEITGINAYEKIYSWAVGASITNVATLLIDHYKLPAVALSAAVALAIILVRAARSSKDAPKA